MTQPHEHEDPPLSLDPIVGWRTWRLKRHDDVPTLVSVTREVMWPPQAVMRSACIACGANGPGRACSCGLYAASTPEYLAASGIFNARTSVVGAVAMWGRVVEHDNGARARFAYPARLRLVCATCLQQGRGGVVPSHVLVDSLGSMVALCEKHRSDATGTRHDARAIESELLSTYAVELLPKERTDRRLKVKRAHEALTAEAVAVMGIRVLGFILQLYMIFWVAVGVLAFVLVLVGIIVGIFMPDHPSLSHIVSPVAPHP